MFPRRIHAGLSVALAVGTMLSCGLGPSMRHTHGEAVAAYDHAACGICSVASTTTHWHVSWLGWEFTLTAPVVPLGGGMPVEDELIANTAVAVVSANDQPIVAGPEGAADFAHEHAPTVSAILVVEARTTPCTLSAVPPARQSLSDAARHERSGVQII